MYRKSKRIKILLSLSMVFIFVAAFLPMASAADPSALYTEGDTSSKRVALTFDDGDPLEKVQPLLDILDANDIKSTFFITGEMAEAYPDSLLAIDQAGHELANHAYSHTDLTTLSYDEIREEISDTENIMSGITGKTTKPLFRPPYGSYNSTVLEAAGDEGYPTTVNWSLDSYDYNDIPADEIYDNVVGNIAPGAIVLMHTGDNNNIYALQDIIDTLTAQGYSFVTVSEILEEPVQSVNLATGKVPSSSKAFTDPSFMTDGNKSTNSYSDDYPNSGLAWVQLDLGGINQISGIKLWHYFGDSRKYHDVVVQLSNDPNFAAGVTTVYNNDTDNSAGRGAGTKSEYTESSSGLDIPVNDVNARYARFYSNGSTANSNNHYVEIEISGSPAEVVHPASISLNKAAATLATGATDMLTATVLPADATDKSVTWSSTKPAVAAVSPSGLVTGVSAGTATITAKTVDGELTATCTVTVTAPVTGNLAYGKLPTSSLTFTGLAYVTDGGKSVNNYADSYTNSGIQWLQLDLGTAYNVSDIKLWHYFGDSRKYHDVVVQLSNDPEFTAGVNTVYNNDTNNSAGRGTGANSEYTETSAGLDIPFSAVNARYARFYTNGSTANSYNHYVEIEIYASGETVHPASVSLNKTTATLEAGASETLTAAVLPANATNKDVTWSTSAPDVATVSPAGLVTGVSAGTATVTAATVDGGLTAACEVTVIPAVVHPSSVTLNKTTEALDIGGTDTLTATVLPSNAANKDVVWSSSAASVASVSASGLVTALSAGTAVITATAVDGGLKATCQITVTSAAEGNLAAGKLPSSSAAFTGLQKVTDGDMNTNNYADSYTNSGLQWIQIDLGASRSVSDIKLWHYFGDSRKYHDVIVQLSNDPAFAAGVTTVYNNDANNSAGRGTGTNGEYTETNEGLDIVFSTVNARYVRLYSNGSTANSYNHYVEVEIYGSQPPAVTNLAAGKPLLSSAAFTNPALVTNGDKNTNNYADSYTNSGLQWIQVDLGASYSVGSVKLWHYFGDSRKYHDVVVQLSNDPDFATDVTTVYNNDTNNSAGRGTGTGSEYTETSAGLILNFSPVNARYARFYSNGSTANSYNHYVEVEIYGN
ncbi:MAG: polysaccharide deacetylase family protein [Firmicutes bacterium]|nr:polysaccharide deacetylase family protein [Bacillota bacterium]